MFGLLDRLLHRGDHGLDTSERRDLLTISIATLGKIPGWFIWPFKGVNRKLIGLIGLLKRV